MKLKKLLIIGLLSIPGMCFASASISNIFVKSILVRNVPGAPIVVRFAWPNGSDVQFNEPGATDGSGIVISGNGDITRFFLSQLLSAFVNKKSVDVSTNGIVGTTPKNPILDQVTIH
jgi:hypothetical protein